MEIKFAQSIGIEVCLARLLDRVLKVVIQKVEQLGAHWIHRVVLQEPRRQQISPYIYLFPRYLSLILIWALFVFCPYFGGVWDRMPKYRLIHLRYLGIKNVNIISHIIYSPV